MKFFHAFVSASSLLGLILPAIAAKKLPAPTVHL